MIFYFNSIIRKRDEDDNYNPRCHFDSPEAKRNLLRSRERFQEKERTGGGMLSEEISRRFASLEMTTKTRLSFRTMWESLLRQRWEISQKSGSAAQKKPLKGQLLAQEISRRSPESFRDRFPRNDKKKNKTVISNLVGRLVRRRWEISQKPESAPQKSRLRCNFFRRRFLVASLPSKWQQKQRCHFDSPEAKRNLLSIRKHHREKAAEGTTFFHKRFLARTSLEMTG